MKAVRVHKFDLSVPMQEEEIEDYASEPGEILVRAGAMGVNPVDIAIRAAKHPYAKLVTPP